MRVFLIICLVILFGCNKETVTNYHELKFNITNLDAITETEFKINENLLYKWDVEPPGIEYWVSDKHVTGDELSIKASCYSDEPIVVEIRDGDTPIVVFLSTSLEEVLDSLTVTRQEIDTVYSLK